MPAPSPITKPSRSLSKGREASSGSSLRRDRAFRAQNPPTAKGVKALSVPPQTMAVASPRWRIRSPSPMEWFAVAQALTTAMFGPLRPKSIEIQPEAILIINMGIINGENFLGPYFSQ